LKPLYHTNGMERIQTNPVHMSLRWKGIHGRRLQFRFCCSLHCQ
jgi:hypothetical protein